MKTSKNYALAAVGLALAAETMRNFLERQRALAATGLVVLLLIAGTLSGLSHVPGVVLSGSGTATIDGVFNASEWTNAGTITFAANLPEGGTTPATLYAMNNRTNLFLALRLARPSLDVVDALFFDFDNNHDGGLANGEDAVFFDNNIPTGLRDRFRPASDDTADGGTNDGAGARGNAGGFTIIELSHPLNSGDPHDFSLVPGNTVGFRLVLNIHNGTNLGTTTFPPSTGMGDIVIASNHPPTAQSLTVSGPANMPTPIHLAASDADGDALTFGFSSPGHGTLSGTPPNLIYTPSLNFIGTDSFTYKAGDGLAESGLAQVALTIKNGVSINDAFVTEGNRGTINAVFTVRLTAPVTGELKIDYVTAPRTATAGTDYLTTQGSLLFVQGGSTQQTVAVTVIGDTLFEINESFNVVLSSSSDVFIFDDLGLGGIINDDPSVGTSALAPPDSIVHVGERVNLSLTWVHPIQWRKLDSLDLLIIDDEGEALAVRWQEPDDTFSLFNPAADRFVRTAPARSSARFETSVATLFLDQSSSQGSGPTGHSVTVNYSVIFKPKAADRVFRVEAFATDDDGNQQGFEEVGTIAVLRK